MIFEYEVYVWFTAFVVAIIVGKKEAKKIIIKAASSENPNEMIIIGSNAVTGNTLKLFNEGINSFLTVEFIPRKNPEKTPTLILIVKPKDILLRLAIASETASPFLQIVKSSWNTSVGKGR